MARTKRGMGMNFKLLFACIFVCALAAAIGGFFTADAIGSWYAGLQKPALNPPNWVFGPVWAALYLLMGISLYMVLKNGVLKARRAIGIFSLQLILNVLWSFAFFWMHSPFLGIMVIVALWASILYTIIEFRKVSETAWLLLIPYILWVSFAAVLNYQIMILNP